MIFGIPQLDALEHLFFYLQEVKGHNIDDVKNEEKNLGPLEEDDGR